MDDRRALVLGGGGVTGIAWEVGLLFGLLEAGVDLSAADLVVGTSAGAAVAAQLRSGTDLAELFEAQLEDRSQEISARVGPTALVQLLVAMAWPGSRQRSLARLGRAALATPTVPEDVRRQVIARRLPSHEWPDRDLLVTAVDTATGGFRVFGRVDEVPLVDAVGASCAVPLVWPPVRIADRRYMDGGMRSVTNADLATGCGTVVVLAPQTGAIRPSDRIGRQLATLGETTLTAVVSGDAAARKAMGRNGLDPSRAAPAAEAGRAQATAEASRLRAVWDR